MPGLRFRKLDLHTHTPASRCYLRKDDTPEMIVQAALDKGLSAIAITDHNTAEWIDSMQTAAKGTELVVFPGVEISMGEKFHLVALFDPSVDQKHVEGLLATIEIPVADFGRSETLCTKSAYDVIDRIHARNGLAVLAHIDRPSGAFTALSERREDGKVKVPVPCSKLFNEARYDAVECIDGVLPEGFDAAHHIERTPPIYQASDNLAPGTNKHAYEGLGTLYSWFKLDQIDLEGLRQCFVDPSQRIRMMDDYEEHGYPRIVSLSIGDRGFLRNQSIEFHEGLNSIIGGKGVGKSMAVEFLRFGLAQPSPDPVLGEDHRGKLSKRLEPDNSVSVTYQLSDGTKYRLTRHLVDVRRDNTLETQDECVNLDTGEVYAGEWPVIFPVLAYSQTEVIKIAENKDAQLQLLDRLIDTRASEQEITRIRAELAENDDQFSAAIQARDNLVSLEKDLNTVKAQILAINKALDNPLFASMKAAETKKSHLDERYTYLAELIDRVRGWRESVQSENVEALPEALAEDVHLVQVQTAAEQAQAHVVQVLSDLIEELGQRKSVISDTNMAWLPEFDALQKSYRELVSEIGGSQEVKDRERKRLEGQRKDLEAQATKYKRQVESLEDIIAKRDGLLDELERAYRGYYELRREKFDGLAALSNGKLSLSLEHAANRAAYEEKLVQLLKSGSNAVSVADRRKIAQNVLPRRLVQLVLDRNIPHLANEADITETWAGRAIEKLWASDDFREVLALQHNCFPADVPSIQFRKEGGQYGELSELSVGQKCTALLIIALCDGSMPVVIDQPEDALDIISVWEDIAKQLRRGKDSRQFILTTHNSSVAVAADSDQFIVLRAGADRGRVVAAGAIDREDVRKAVIDHLEGGDEPYKLRAAKYNIQ